MALDTRNKRASAIAFDKPGAGPFPNPDGTINAADRQHVVGKYAGILAGAGEGKNPYRPEIKLRRRA